MPKNDDGLQGRAHQRQGWQGNFSKEPRRRAGRLMARIALDANILLLQVVGLTEPFMLGSVICFGNTLKPFTRTDYELLCDFIIGAEQIVATPNALTEVSNLLKFGVKEPLSVKCILPGSELYKTFQGLIQTIGENYWPSAIASTDIEFVRLGLTDCTWLGVIDPETVFLTNDHNLYLQACSRGLTAYNFTHLLEQRGLL